MGAACGCDGDNRKAYEQTQANPDMKPERRPIKQHINTTKKVHDESVLSSDEEYESADPSSAPSSDEPKQPYKSEQRASIQHYRDYRQTQIQQEIINNESLRNESLQLLSDNNQGLIKFMKKMIASDVSVNKIWNKIDSSGTGKIGTKKLAKFLTLPVIFYKATQHQKNKENKGTAFKPNIDISCVEHLSVWIICSYGVKTEDGSYRISIAKIDFKKKLIGWFQEYIDCDGMMDE
eukprot:CAMPEP_0201569468 /NCGR_PEP_ID=MMETSP0190_2-20130828/11153_1 /ASSEMBLY_ACC=CAM_ASM_000263 /TAXON_ID=37353 /ORGANISM="Rosalina sp." /LENGTH=234 /DNA_ID=CAMNT_0047991797 /DNA_START=20 /DNA_END=724 /DNA_ORIENTATION=-